MRWFLPLVAVLLAAPAWAQLEIAVEELSVTAKGLTPGGEVVWFGLTRVWMTGADKSRVVAQTATADAAGEARYDATEGVPRVSVWAVVDLQTGGNALAVPEGMKARELRLPPGAFRRAVSGEFESLGERRESLHTLLVRPRVGAWVSFAGDGTDSDGDRARDQVVTVAFKAMNPLGTSGTAPSGLRQGDILVILDPRSMEIASVEFDPGKF